MIYLDTFPSKEDEGTLHRKYTAWDSSSSISLLPLCRMRIHLRSALTVKLAGLSALYKFIEINKYFDNKKIWIFQETIIGEIFSV